MFAAQAAFSGLSVDDQAKAKEFYTKVLGLKLTDETMGLDFDLPGGGLYSSIQKKIISQRRTRRSISLSMTLTQQLMNW